MIRVIPLLAVILLLGGCAQDFNSYSQDITLLTPGTDGAICYLERPGYHRRVWTPKTVRITKSNEPLEVRCLAPGNREQTVIVEPEGLYLGRTVRDFIPGGLYSFPDVVVVDFTYMEPREMPPPDYQRVIEQNPGIVGMEEFRPGAAALQRDKYWHAPELQKRRSSTELFSGGNLTEVRTTEESARLSGGGHPESPDKSVDNAAKTGSQPLQSSGKQAQPLTESGASNGVVGGTPVIGSEADKTGTLDNYGILAPGEEPAPVSIPEDQQDVHGPVILYPESK